MRLAIVRLIIWLLVAVWFAIWISYYLSVGVIEWQQDQLDWAITWTIAQRLNWLKATRERMSIEKDNIEKLKAIKEELEIELQDAEINYSLLNETENIFKQEIKDEAGLH